MSTLSQNGLSQIWFAWVHPFRKTRFFAKATLYAPRMPADPFARSAVSSQRSLLTAQFSRSAVSIIPSKPGRAPGVGPLGPQRRAPLGGRGPRFYAPKGPLRGPWAQGGGRLRRPWAHGGRWDDFEAILNGMFFRWCFAPSHPCIAEVGQNRIHFLTSEALKEGFFCSDALTRSPSKGRRIWRCF